MSQTGLPVGVTIFSSLQQEVKASSQNVFIVSLGSHSPPAFAVSFPLLQHSQHVTSCSPLMVSFVSHGMFLLKNDKMFVKS